MTSPAPQWWYSVISAAPRPETAERVNVGLLLGNGRPRVEFVPGLPRLAGLVAPDELAVFSTILESLTQSVADGVDIAVLRQFAGPQLQIGSPKTLYVEPGDKIVRSLLRNLLESPHLQGSWAEQRVARTEGEHELDRLIGSVVPAVGLRVERRPTLQKLYEQLPAKIAEMRFPSLARALRAPRRDILLDSVSVGTNDPLAAIRIATTRVGRAFWYYKRLRPEIEGSTGREVRTVGILLNGIPHKSSQITEAREYITHVWKADADLVVDMDRAEDLETLRKQVRWLTE